MKKAKKVLLLVLCAALLVGASITGTLAYLTSTTDTVTNTFTVGKVKITLDEAKVDEYGKLLYTTGEKDDEGNPVYTTNADAEGAKMADRVTANKYKLIPGHNYFKDPVIHVDGSSEACWLFVMIENTNENAIINGLEKNGWKPIEQTNYWKYEAATFGANSNVPVFDSFTYGNVEDTTTDSETEIKVTAYAIQADGFSSSDDAWEALKDQLSLNLNP